MLKGIFGILIGVLLVISIMFGKLVITSDLKTEDEVLVQNPKYHIQLIVQDTDEYFWTMFRSGATAASEEFGVYTEFVTISQRNVDDLRVAMEMGVNSGVDGIALQAADSQQTSLMVDDAKEHGVEILTYENDNYQIQNTPMVGTNSYSLGGITGDLAIEATGGYANVAVIINNEGDQGDVQYNNMLIQGLRDSLIGHNAMTFDSINNIYKINATLFEAEKIATSIFDEPNRFDAIICFDESSTPGIAQMLVDNNLVGDIKLIGYGLMPRTMDYIKRGVIYATVCPDAYQIGYKAVKQLTESLDGTQISDSDNTDLFTINKSNVEQFSKELEDNQEGTDQ